MGAAAATRTAASIGRGFLLSLCLTVCSRGSETNLGRTAGPPDAAPGLVGDAGPLGETSTCSSAEEDGESKIRHMAYLREHADVTHPITVTLRARGWVPPPCHGDESDDATCAARDEALRVRQRTNQTSVGCMLQRLGGGQPVGNPVPVWYEPARRLSSGMPVPIATRFSIRALVPQILRLASHPDVESIAPAFGESANIKFPAPPPPPDCPVANDPTADKLVDAVSVHTPGRHPVVVEMRLSSLPPIPACIDGRCSAIVAASWARAIVGRRSLTCVRSFIDLSLVGAAPDVDYAAAEGFPQGMPSLPPFDELPHVTTAFGLALTWAEVSAIARHPFVARIWTADTLRVREQPAGCPPNYDEPVAQPTCPSALTDPVEGKFTAASRAAWEASTEANEVVIAVRRTDPVCPRPACREPMQCPEASQYAARMQEEAAASQACVRALITSIGGTASPEIFTLGNSFPATLTWAQIQTVASHPHVVQIDGRFDNSLPP